MMKDNRNFNSEFEELLKSRMNELADSVDCFDKISKRAYPRSETGFTDEGITVCELENVTGRKNFFRFMPAVAIMAACALCLFFLPKNSSFVEFVSSHFGKSDEKAYREIISEIKEETDESTYRIYDLPLKEYISKDILVTPLFSCPFEKNENENLSVRLFIRMCGSIPTNQVYAVVYEGSYDDGDYIAAAESTAKFTDEEINELAESLRVLGVPSSALRVDNKFFGTKGSSFTDTEGNSITLAGFDFNCIYKQGDKTSFITGSTAYYAPDSNNEDATHYYDIEAVSSYSQIGNAVNVLDLSEASKFYDASAMWANVLYFNGDSARAESELSDFVQKELFTDEGVIAFPYNVYPYSNETHFEAAHHSLTVERSDGSSGKIYSPMISDVTENFRVYIPDACEEYRIISADNSIDNTFLTEESVSVSNSDSYAIEAIVIGTETEISIYNEEIIRIEAQLESIADEDERQNLENSRNFFILKKNAAEQRLAELNGETYSPAESETG